MILELKVSHPEYYPDGTWLIIANENDMGKVNDEEIYFYVEDNFDLFKVKIGDTIELDEPFKVLDIN